MRLTQFTIKSHTQAHAAGAVARGSVGLSDAPVRARGGPRVLSTAHIGSQIGTLGNRRAKYRPSKAQADCTETLTGASNSNGATNEVQDTGMSEDDSNGNGNANGHSSGNGTGSGSSALSMTELLRKEEQTEFVGGAGAQSAAPANNAPNPASSWLPYAEPSAIQQTPAKTTRARAVRNLVRVKDRLCTIPDYVTSQFTYRVQKVMLSNTLVKLGGVFVVALPAVFLGGAVYSKLTGGELKDGFLKIYEVLYIIPGVNVAGESNPLSWVLLNGIFLVGSYVFAVVLGLVSDDTSQELKAIRSGNYPVVIENHILLLNWNRQTAPLLRQLALANKQQYSGRPRDVVVLAEADKEWMDGEMKAALKGYNIQWQTRQGSPYAAADLQRVSAGASSMIVLMRPEEGKHIAAREVAAIVGIHALRTNQKKHRHQRQSMIVQAPEDGTDVVAAAKRVLRSSALESLGLQDKRDMSMLIAQSALQPGVASVHCAILQKSPNGVSLFLRPVMEILVGKSFRHARRSFADAVVCGLFRGKDQKPILNPGEDMLLEDQDRLIMLSHTSMFRPNKDGPLQLFVDAAGRRDTSQPGLVFQRRNSSVEPEPLKPRNVVVAGWCGDIGYLHAGLKSFAPAGSVVTIISECAPSEMPTGEMDGVTFQHLPGYAHNTLCLEEAGVREADAIIIGPADDLSDKEADAQLVSMLMLLQDILLDDLNQSSSRNGNGNGTVNSWRDVEKKAPTHVVGVVRCPPSVEVANYLVRDLAKNTMTAELLQPDELVSGLMSQVAAEPDLAMVLPLLIDSWEGNQIRLREPTELGISDLHETNFAEVSERAALIEEVAIGFVTRVGTLVLAPHISHSRIYRNTDRVIVFATETR